MREYTTVMFPPAALALQEFTSYLQKHDEVLTELEKASKRLKKLETVYKEFENASASCREIV